MRFVARRSQTSIALFSLLLVAVLGVGDYVTGPEISFSIFYLIPIGLVAWVVGFAAGAVTSVAAALAFLTDSVGRASFSHATIPYWNALVRLGFFFIVASTLSSLRTARDRREELRQFIIHDLRSPLTNVMTGLEILNDDEERRLSPDQKTFVEMCTVSCTRMLTLINSLLDIPRLERRQMPLRMDRVRARALCEAALDQVRLWARQRSIAIVEEYPRDDALVEADPGITIRVLENILSNAIKFSREGSKITIRVYHHDSRLIAFSIQNEGEGIPDEWSDRVFESYEQVDTSPALAATGTGLGLTFSRYAVEAQGGKIWLKSENGTGTTVTFTLPIAPDERGSSA